jgi:hypothetical protein
MNAKLSSCIRTRRVLVLKHAWVPRARDWPYSSFHHDVRAGIFPEDWAGDIDAGGEFVGRIVIRH